MSDSAAAAAAATPAQPAPASAQKRFIPVHISTLDHAAPPLDLYLQHAGSAAPTLYRGTGVDFTPDDAKRLVEQDVQFFHIDAEQHHIYRRCIAARIEALCAGANSPAPKRARAVRAAIERTLLDVLSQAGQPEPVEAVVDAGRVIAAWAANDPSGFSYLLDLNERQFSNVDHMINVGAGCALLAQALLPGDAEALHAFLVGGFLHNIGVRAIPESLLLKEGRLSEPDFDLLRPHTHAAFEELGRIAAVPQPALDIARDHHERLDGLGYPRQRRGNEIPQPARVCAVVDVFDSIAAGRPTRDATPPADVLRIMGEGVGRQFDPEVFAAWRTLIGNLITADPRRALPPSPVPPAVTLGDFLPVGKINEVVVAAETESTVWGSNRRRFPRADCNLPGRAWFLRQGRSVPVRVGEPFDVMVLDLSRGGARVSTPWPCALNDLLVLEIPGKDGRVLRRSVRVARAGRENAGRWKIGLQFVADEAANAA